MRRTKIIVSLLLCFAFVLATFLIYNSAAAEGDPTGAANEIETADAPLTEEDGGVGALSLEDILLEYAEAINSLQEQVNAITIQLNAVTSALSSSSGVDNALISLQAGQAVIAKKNTYRNEYYSICLLLAHSKLLERQVEMLEKQLEVEKVKLSLGESTQIKVDILSAQLTSVREQAKAESASAETKRTRLNAGAMFAGYSFISDYTVPQTVTERFTASLDTLISSYTQNNATLASYDSQIRSLQQNLPILSGSDYDALLNSINLLYTQRDAYREQLVWVAADAYTKYTEALAQYTAYSSLRTVLNEQLQLIKTMAELGEISEVERLRQTYEVYSELYNLDSASSQLLMAIAALDAMMEGVG